MWAPRPYKKLPIDNARIEWDAVYQRFKEHLKPSSLLDTKPNPSCTDARVFLVRLLRLFPRSEPPMAGKAAAMIV